MDNKTVYFTGIDPYKDEEGKVVIGKLISLNEKIVAEYIGRPYIPLPTHSPEKMMEIIKRDLWKEE